MKCSLTGLAIEKLQSKFENVDVAVRENATVRVVLLAPRGSLFSLLLAFNYIISRRGLALK